MRIWFRRAAALALALCLWNGYAGAARKRSTAKKPVARTAKAGRSGGKYTGKSTGKSGRKTAAAKTTWRNRQTAPTPERYREIQQALVDKGYLAAGEVTGSWSPASADAMRRFQADQKLDGGGKINSRSLIALGLGPKPGEAQVDVKAPPAPQPPQTDKPVQ